jgi:plasmid stabilization system protein ParE
LSFPYVVRPAARLELRHALDYYAVEVPHKLDELESAIDDAFELLANAPLRHRVRRQGYRCIFVSGFPYQLWYDWHDTHEISEVVAFLHARQSGDVLKERR